MDVLPCLLAWPSSPAGASSWVELRANSAAGCSEAGRSASRRSFLLAGAFGASPRLSVGASSAILIAGSSD
eukprot:365160-Chlamydomonas_euryale.AAC.5